jgi:protein-tyrosine phosphatase
VENLRDVRGLRTDDGRIVRRAVLYRGETPRTPHAGRTGVAVWPPAVVVDLRTIAEAHLHGGGRHALDRPGTAVYSVPMGASLAPALSGAQTTDGDLTAAYRHLVRDAADAIAAIVGIVARAPGPALVHCTAGKDRTGIVVAVLLRAAGVRRDDVVADYLRTEENLPRLWAALRAAGVREPRNRALLGVQGPALEAVLDEVEAHPGGAAGWLATHGVDPADLDRFVARLVGPAAAEAA